MLGLSHSSAQAAISHNTAQALRNAFCKIHSDGVRFLFNTFQRGYLGCVEMRSILIRGAECCKLS